MHSGMHAGEAEPRAAERPSARRDRSALSVPRPALRRTRRGVRSGSTSDPIDRRTCICSAWHPRSDARRLTRRPRQRDHQPTLAAADISSSGSGRRRDRRRRSRRTSTARGASSRCSEHVVRNGQRDRSASVRARPIACGRSSRRTAPVCRVRRRRASLVQPSGALRSRRPRWAASAQSTVCLPGVESCVFARVSTHVRRPRALREDRRVPPTAGSRSLRGGCERRYLNSFEWRRDASPPDSDCGGSRWTR